VCLCVCVSVCLYVCVCVSSLLTRATRAYMQCPTADGTASSANAAGLCLKGNNPYQVDQTENDRDTAGNIVKTGGDAGCPIVYLLRSADDVFMSHQLTHSFPRRQRAHLAPLCSHQLGRQHHEVADPRRHRQERCVCVCVCSCFLCACLLMFSLLPGVITDVVNDLTTTWRTIVYLCLISFGAQNSLCSRHRLPAC
jgi:hypothetical protein